MHDSTPLGEIDGMVDRSVIYAFKRTVVPDVMVGQQNDLRFCFEGVEGFFKFCRVLPSTRIGSLINKFYGRVLGVESRLMLGERNDIDSVNIPATSLNLTFQFRDIVLHTNHSYGVGFNSSSEVRHVPGLVHGCCIYIFKNTS